MQLIIWQHTIFIYLLKNTLIYYDLKYKNYYIQYLHYTNYVYFPLSFDFISTTINNLDISAYGY